MIDNFDINTVTAEFLKQNLDSLYDGAKNLLKGASSKIKLNLDATYRGYLSTLLEKYSKAKSFLLRGEAVPLYNFYVPLDLIGKKKCIQSVGFSDIFKFASNIIITGSAGCGKSMMVRHLLIDAVRSKSSIPVFVELRQFNTFDGDLIKLISKCIATIKFKMDEDYIRKAIELGHFAIFLDGYDEIIHDRRQKVSAYIRDFVKVYDKSIIIMTSRPDPQLEGWQFFSHFQISELSKEQACTLIDKLPFDDKIKERFLLDLRNKMFEKHKSFLSNPLLLSIMLLSYGQSASIPNKLSVFYNQAYEALFERHDVLKDGFKRRLHTSLDIQDFSRLFSSFCIQTYDKRQVEFSHTEALEFIESSQDISGIYCDKEAYLQDLIQAVCLLVQDGLQIVFAHRSFQEYFAARFISHSKPEVQEKLIQRYTQDVPRDNVISMLHEMRLEVVEQYYIIPKLERLFEKIGVKRSIGVTHHERFMRACCSGIMIGSDNLGFACSGKDWASLELAFFTLNQCGEMATKKIIFGNRNEEKILANKWFKIVGTGEVELKSDKQSRAIIRDIAKSDGIFSIKMLNALFEILQALKKKAQKQEKTLNSILKY